MNFSKINLRYLLLSFSIFCLLYSSGCDPAKKGSGKSGTTQDTSRNDKKVQPSAIPRGTTGNTDTTKPGR